MQGMVLLTASAWLPGLTPGPEDGTAKWWQGAMLFGALYIVALGTGGAAQQTCLLPPAGRLLRTSMRILHGLMLRMQTAGYIHPETGICLSDSR